MRLRNPVDTRLGQKRRPISSFQHVAPLTRPKSKRAVRNPASLQLSDAATAALPQHADVPNSDFQVLSTWVQSSGGYIHPSLQLVDVAPCGCRGVTTKKYIDIEELRSAPLVLVPEALYMTSQAGREKFSQTVPQELAQVYDRLPGPVQLALLLAAEHHRGQESFWHPYISCLPDDPPCAWWWDKSQLRQFIINNDLPHDWIDRIQAFRERSLQQLQALTGRFGVLQLPDTSVAWSYAQVLSRCFGNASNVGLAPFIDLLNHSNSASAPKGVELDGETYVYVSSIRQGQPRPLQAGEELYISYVQNCDPYNTLLNFGFIPAELLQSQQSNEPVVSPLTKLEWNHQSC